MRIISTLASIAENQDTITRLQKLQVGDVLAFDSILPALALGAATAFKCKTIVQSLYTFDITFLDVPLGTVQILHDGDYLAITLEEIK